MTEEKKNWLGPYIPEGSFVRELIQQAKLAYNLMLDPRVHPLSKLIPIAAVTYLFMPVDISPDVIPVLGQLDDVAVVMLGMRMFFELAPADVVREHLKRLTETIRGSWTVLDDDNPTPATEPGPAPPGPGPDVVDGSYRVEEERPSD